MNYDVFPLEPNTWNEYVVSIVNPLSFPLDCYGKDVCGLISSTVTYSGV